MRVICPVSEKYVVRRSVQRDVVHKITVLGTQFSATKTRAGAEHSHGLIEVLQLTTRLCASK
jgi:hypothetical protein